MVLLMSSGARVFVSIVQRCGEVQRVETTMTTVHSICHYLYLLLRIVTTRYRHTCLHRHAKIKTKIKHRRQTLAILSRGGPVVKEDS